jgi:integration host factor subunit alpha
MLTGLVTVGAVRGTNYHIRFSEGEGIIMTAGTLTRADIATRINQQIGLSRNESASIVESILDHMSDALAVGQNVKISGFGTFVLRDKAQRIGRNPKTGIEVPITPRRVLTFRASQMLKERICGK